MVITKITKNNFAVNFNFKDLASLVMVYATQKFTKKQSASKILNGNGLYKDLGDYVVIKRNIYPQTKKAITILKKANCPYTKDMNKRLVFQNRF